MADGTSMKTLNGGVSLVEVLVSIVLLSVGLLGTAGLMGASMRNTNTAYQRSQATVLADDILDRMRANAEEARAGNYNISAGPTYSATTAMSRYDTAEWISMVQSTLPGGQARVTVDGNPNSHVAEIWIEWGEVSDGGFANSFITRSRL